MSVYGSLPLLLPTFSLSLASSSFGYCLCEFSLFACLSTKFYCHHIHPRIIQIFSPSAFFNSFIQFFLPSSFSLPLSPSSPFCHSDLYKRADSASSSSSPSCPIERGPAAARETHRHVRRGVRFHSPKSAVLVFFLSLPLPPNVAFRVACSFPNFVKKKRRMVLVSTESGGVLVCLFGLSDWFACLC